jgi:hypothetical protein
MKLHCWHHEETNCRALYAIPQFRIVNVSLLWRRNLNSFESLPRIIVSYCIHKQEANGPANYILWLWSPYIHGIAQAVIGQIPTAVSGYLPRLGHVELVCIKMTLSGILAEYFDLPCQFSFHKLPHIY